MSRWFGDSLITICKDKVSYTNDNVEEKATILEFPERKFLFSSLPRIPLAMLSVMMIVCGEFVGFTALFCVE